VLKLVVVIGADQSAGIIGVCQSRGFHRLVARENGDVDAIFVEMPLLHQAIVVVFLFRANVLS
jgi:hypothetical protein